MSGKNPSFPLTLSALDAAALRKRRDHDQAHVSFRIATPQTATRNAVQNAAQNASSSLPGSRYAVAQPVAVPSKSHLTALARAVADAGAAGGSASRQNALVSDAVRRTMVARVARQGVKDALVLAALTLVPRHAFVQDGLASQAYIDAALPIGHQQTISKPYIVARMIEVMRGGASLKRVLEIGTGCGYQAAVLARVALEVFSIERIKPLHELAKSNLRPMRLPNLRLHYGDGMLGLPQAAPFDGIILAAAGLTVPQALLEQLAIGGRLVAPVGAASQHLQLTTRAGKAEWISETLESCHFVPLCPGMA
jgi:protein-L-isoaspartate(D-aspartate) O-methyltransferase